MKSRALEREITLIMVFKSKQSLLRYLVIGTLYLILYLMYSCFENDVQ